MLKQVWMKEWRSRVSQPRILWEMTNQMFTQPDAGLPVGTAPTYPRVRVHLIRSDTTLFCIILNTKTSLSSALLERNVVTWRLLSTENAIPIVKDIGIVLVTQQHKQKIQARTLEII
jgi:hypothetical protein